MNPDKYIIKVLYGQLYEKVLPVKNKENCAVTLGWFRCKKESTIDNWYFYIEKAKKELEPMSLKEARELCHAEALMYELSL